MIHLIRLCRGVGVFLGAIMMILTAPIWIFYAVGYILFEDDDS